MGQGTLGDSDIILSVSIYLPWIKAINWWKMILTAPGEDGLGEDACG